MEKTLKVLNQLEKEGLIERYAIGGAIALLFYTEPMLTYDMDIFVFLPKRKGKLILLSPLYDDLRKKGYREDKEHVVIEGIPVQFIPAYNKLIEEAVKEADEIKYKGVKTRVVQLEYLVAIMLQTGRSKDKSKFALVLEQTKLNRDQLSRIVARHGLAEKWAQLKNH